jgi:hypothetical protein
MTHCSTLMGQLLQLLPRRVFDHLVDSHAWQGPNPRKFTYWSLSAELAPQPQKAPQIKIIDATTIDLCAAVFPWAKFRTRKEAIKLHTVLTGLLPQCVLVTDGKTHDLQAAQDLRFKPGDLLILIGPIWIMPGFTSCTKTPSGL